MKKIVLLLSMGLLLFSCGPQENPDPGVLSVTTGTVTNITTTTASCSGNVTSDGGSSVTARGVCWSTSENPTTSNSKTTNGTGLGTYTSNITGLSPNTTYYVRAYATNSQGTAYGEQRTFRTLTASDIEYGSFTDSRDGKVYKTVTIGEQVWMAENLAYLPSVVGPATESYTAPYYYVYGYDGTSVATAKATTNYQTYGVLYNWPAALTACPSGWHLPSDAEWTQMKNYLIANGYNNIAISLASANGWQSSSNIGAIGNDNRIIIKNLQHPFFEKYYVSNRGKLNYSDFKRSSNMVEELGRNGPRRSLYKPGDHAEIKPLMYQAFRTAAENFQLIDQGTTGVIVPYHNQELLEELELAMNQKDYNGVKKLLQKLQRYTINVYLSPKLEPYIYQNKDYGVYFLIEEYYNGRKGIITEELADWIL